MKLTGNKLIAALILSAGLSAPSFGADQDFAPNRSYADPAAPVEANKVTSTTGFSPFKSYADPAAPASNEQPKEPGFNPKKSYADPAAPAS